MNALFLLAPLTLISVGIIVGCIVVGSALIIRRFTDDRNHITGVCIPSRSNTLTGAYTRPRRFYHINITQLVRRREYVDIE